MKRLIFLVVILTAIYLIIYGLTVQASTKQATYTPTWCDKINGVKVVDNGLVIPCLTSKYAIFTKAQPIAKYLIEYKDKYNQIPLLKLKEKQDGK